MILAIDPGKDKTGLAIIGLENDEIEIKERNIIQTGRFEVFFEYLFNKYKIEEIVLGNSTTSEKMENILKKIRQEKELKYSINIIEEDYSTREAEKLYIKENYPFLMRKIFDIISWKPGIDVDDYAAVILGKRYLNKS